MTGAASGIGEAIATAFIEEGRVALRSREEIPTIYTLRILQRLLCRAACYFPCLDGWFTTKD